MGAIPASLSRRSAGLSGRNIFSRQFAVRPKNGDLVANLPTRILLFLSSYAPLLFILTLRTYKDLGWWSIVFAAIGLIAVGALIAYLTLARTLTKFSITIDNVSNKNAEAMSYIASYIIPFIDLPFDDWKNTVSLLIFFVMLGVIYVNSNMVHVNPVLNIMFFHLFEVESGGELRSLITRRRHIPRGTSITVHKLGNDVCLEAAK